MGDGLRARAALLTWIMVLAGAILVFTSIGDGALAAPAWDRPGTWVAWASSRPAADVVFALGRLGVLGLAWYLAAVTALGVLARLARCVRLVQMVDALSMPLPRHLLHASLGLGLATAAVAPAAVTGVPRDQAARTAAIVAAAAGDEPLTPVELLLQPPTPPTSTETTRPDQRPTPGADDEAHAGDGADHQASNADGSAGNDAVGAGGARGAGRSAVGQDSRAVWTVAPGDHFWSIAERVVSAHLDRPAPDRAVARYWRRLIAANADRLVHAGDPDLIYPGQVFTLPPA